MNKEIKAHNIRQKQASIKKIKINKIKKELHQKYIL